MSRAPGVQLEEIWYDLSAPEKAEYAQQVTAALRELRQFTSPVPMRVDGSPLWDNIVGFCPGHHMCNTILSPPSAWLGSIDAELRAGLEARFGATDDAASIDAKLQAIKDNFPPQGTALYVLTHADLNFGNIIVKDGRVTAIIDWELAGYYPWWVERWACRQRAKSWEANELFDLVWAELDLERSDDEFIESVFKPVGAANAAYSDCPVSHSQSHDIWLRKPFCACKNVGGSVKSRHWGVAEMKHEIANVGKTFDRRTKAEGEEARARMIAVQKLKVNAQGQIVPR